MPSQDLSITKRYGCIQGVGDRGTPQRVRTNVPWNVRNLGDPQDPAVAVPQGILVRNRPEL